jgi:hypothetical protein
MFAVLEIIDYIFLVLLFLFFTGSSAYGMFRPRDRFRLYRLERKLDLILKHLAIDASQLDVLSEEARKLADQGLKIQAIRAHRDQTGLGLRAAKDDVEAYLEGKPK